MSIRKAGSGRWNHHYLKLTFKNEFAIPADVVRLDAGDELEVKVRRIIEDVDAPVVSTTGSGADLLLQLAERRRPGWRSAGSRRLDEYLAADARADATEKRRRPKARR